MNALREEILEFISTISTKELKNNHKLRRSLKKLNKALIIKHNSAQTKMISYLHADLLTTN